MFEVRTTSPLDTDWLERDDKITVAAGRRSDFSGAGRNQREQGWHVKSFKEAQAMKKRLEAVPEVSVTIREV